MKFSALRFRGLTMLTLAIATASPVQAQPMDWHPFLSVTPIYQGQGNFDGGGHVSARSAMVRTGATVDIGSGNRAGVILNYDYTDYSFSNPVRLGGAAPWNIVQRYGVSVPLTFGLSKDWSIGLTPSFDWSRENGANTSDAFGWGGIVSTTRRFDNSNRIGFGIGVFDRIEETGVFPLLLIDWRLSDHWRLVNPLPAGPAGPAGLELEYRLDNGWNVGLGAAWRKTRFRLSNAGAIPNGIGEERGVPVFIRANHAFGESVSLNLYAGLLTAGQLRIEDSSGNALNQVDSDTAPFFGATFSARF